MNIAGGVQSEIFWLSQFGKFEKMLNFAALYTLEASRTMRVC